MHSQNKQKGYHTKLPLRDTIGGKGEEEKEKSDSSILLQVDRKGKNSAVASIKCGLVLLSAFEWIYES
jgi:hypothetical protein